MRTLLVVAALWAATLAAPASAAPDPRDGTVLVLGDSMTAQYTDDPGDPLQGWWSRLAERRNLRPVISAQGGGGLIKKGQGCTGTSVRERSKATIERVRPDEIWIAVGKNDTRVCSKGRAVPISPSFRKQAAKAYFAQLASQVRSAGIGLDNVYVTVPWGTNDSRHRASIVLTYVNAARAAGLTFVNIPGCRARRPAMARTRIPREAPISPTGSARACARTSGPRPSRRRRCHQHRKTRTPDP